MSILSNMYMKSNRKCEIRLDKVSGSDYCILEIKLLDGYYGEISAFPDGNVKFILPLHLATEFAELLFDKSIKSKRLDSKQLKDFIQGSRDDCEYMAIYPDDDEEKE